MEISHIQQLTEDFSPQHSLDFKFETLLEISEHFHMEYNEELKKGLEKNLYNKLRDLISEFESKLETLKYTAATLKS